MVNGKFLVAVEDERLWTDNKRVTVKSRLNISGIRKL